VADYQAAYGDDIGVTPANIARVNALVAASEDENLSEGDIDDIVEEANDAIAAEVVLAKINRHVATDIDDDVPTFDD